MPFAEAAIGMLSLIDNREVSPKPVSHFALKGQGNNMGSNRVTLPFNRVDSFKPTISTLVEKPSGSHSDRANLRKSLDLQQVSAAPIAAKNSASDFKFSKPDQNATSLTQLINGHGIDLKESARPLFFGLEKPDG